MINPEANEYLRKSFSETTDFPLFRAVKKGIMLADDAANSIDFLNNLIGRDIRGLLRRAGIMHQIHEDCVSGNLPFTAKMTRMPIGHWHWLEVTSGKVSADVCRTEKAGAFPKDTPNRQDSRLINQPDLFINGTNVIPLRKDLEMARLTHAWLLHGEDQRGEITHLAWGMPYAHEESWMGYINILESLAATEPRSTSAPETPDPKSQLRFNEQIAASLVQNKKDQES